MSVAAAEAPTKPVVRCFHGWRSCEFCGPDTLAPYRKRRVRRRCACCGRFVRAADPDTCVRCVQRGFVALTLF